MRKIIKIEIKLLGSYRNGTQFRGNFFLTPKQKGWLNLGIYWPLSWCQILIPTGPDCHGVENRGLFGNRAFCTHACDWSYMTGNPSDWEYQNPMCNMDAGHMAFTSTFLFHEGVSLPSTQLALTKMKDISFHTAEGLTVYLTKTLGDIISVPHRYTYTDAQISHRPRFLPKHWPSNSQ